MKITNSDYSSYWELQHRPNDIVVNKADNTNLTEQLRCGLNDDGTPIRALIDGDVLERLDKMQELMRTMYSDFGVNRVKVNEEFIKEVSNEYKEIKKLFNSSHESIRDTYMPLLDDTFDTIIFLSSARLQEAIIGTEIVNGMVIIRRLPPELNQIKDFNENDNKMRSYLLKDINELLKSYVLSLIGGGNGDTSLFKTKTYGLSLNDLFNLYENKDDEDLRKTYYNKVFSKTWSLPNNIDI